MPEKFTRAKIVAALNGRLDLLESVYPTREPPLKSRLFLEHLLD